VRESPVSNRRGGGSTRGTQTPGIREDRREKKLLRGDYRSCGILRKEKQEDRREKKKLERGE
jgi:hypothetical protein